MANCGCGLTRVETEAQRRVLRIALALNATMAIVEVAIGIAAHSSSLIADGLDMLADGVAYAIFLAAAGRGGLFKAKAATVSGALLLLLGLGVLADVARRFMTGGAPEGGWIIALGAAALVVNVTVLHLLSKQGEDDVHIRASQIFTKADVIANTTVIASGAAVLLTGSRYFDLLTGAGIAIYVAKEALQIFSEAREARRAELVN